MLKNAVKLKSINSPNNCIYSNIGKNKQAGRRKFLLVVTFLPVFLQDLPIVEPNLNTTQSESESCSVLPDSLRSHGLYSQQNSPGKNTGMGSFYLLQGIIPIQGMNPGLLHCRWILYQLSHEGSPYNVMQIDDPNHSITVNLLQRNKAKFYDYQ